MYLDTANLEEIKKSLDMGVIKGITTNPTILKKENRDRKSQLLDIDDLAKSIIFAQVVGISKDQMIEDLKELLKIRQVLKGDLGIKIPASIDGLKVISRVKKENPEVKVLATAIYSSDQAILASIAGADMLAPYFNRMENNSTDPLAEISKMRTFIDDRNLNTQILAASFKNTSQVVNALVAGSHTATIPYEILLKMAEKDVATKAIEVFYEDGKSI